MTVTVKLSNDVGLTWTDITNSVPLESIRIEEVIDSRATFSLTIEDFSNNITVGKRADILIQDGLDSVLRGPVLTRRYIQHVGYRDIELSGSDYSILLDERLVGTPSGGLYLGPDTSGNYLSVDPIGQTFGTDSYTIHQWFNYLVANPAIEASLYVPTYMPDPYLGEHPIYFSRTTLRSALSELRDIVGPNIHFWIDPGLHFHWQAFPLSTDGSLSSGGGSLPLLLPATTGLTAAPFGIAEAALVDNVTYYGALDPPGMSITFDGTTMTEQPYIAGVTDFILTPAGGNQNVNLPFGTVTVNTGVPFIQGGGSGWYPWPDTDTEGIQSNDATKRQAVVSSDAASVEERAADGASAVLYGNREIIRGSATVRSQSGVFHVGMSLPVAFPTALGINTSFPINHVTTQYLKGDGMRDTTIDFGDAPVGRLTQRRPPKTVLNLKLPLPASKLEVGTPADVNPLPGQTMAIPFTITDVGGQPINTRMAKTVFFKLFYVRPPATTVMTSPPASISPTSALFTLPGVATTYITFDTSAQTGDKAWVAAFVEDT